MLGITYQQLHKYEKGVNRISAGRLHALTRALGVEPGYFFEGLGAGGPSAEQRPGMLELTDLRRAAPVAAGGAPQARARAREGGCRPRAAGGG